MSVGCAHLEQGPIPGPEKENAAMSTEAELRAELERLKRENEALKTRPKTEIGRAHV